MQPQIEQIQAMPGIIRLGSDHGAAPTGNGGGTAARDIICLQRQVLGCSPYLPLPSQWLLRVTGVGTCGFTCDGVMAGENGKLKQNKIKAS